MGILNFTTAKINKILSDSVTHFSDTVKHITAAERTAWNGKAPGGYGLGTGAVPIDDYNNAVNNGWYRGGANYPSKISYANYGMVRVDSIGQIKFQTFYAGDTGNAMISPFMAIRKSSDYGATWSDWEYVNPPMIFGEEYRTTERYLGKPVYVMVVDCGVAPSKSETWIKLNKEISRFISIDTVSYASDTYQTTIPDSVESCKAVLVMSSQSPYIFVKTTTDNFAVNGYHVYARIKYTKSTD